MSENSTIEILAFLSPRIQSLFLSTGLILMTVLVGAVGAVGLVGLAAGALLLAAILPVFLAGNLPPSIMPKSTKNPITMTPTRPVTKPALKAVLGQRLLII